jgi:hypothetical protein
MIGLFVNNHPEEPKGRGRVSESISQHIPGGNNKNYIRVFRLRVNKGHRDM